MMTIKHMATALAIMVGLHGATQAMETAKGTETGETISKRTGTLSHFSTSLKNIEKIIRANIGNLNIIESKMVPTNGVPHILRAPGISNDRLLQPLPVCSMLQAYRSGRMGDGVKLMDYGIIYSFLMPAEDSYNSNLENETSVSLTEDILKNPLTFSGKTKGKIGDIITYYTQLVDETAIIRQKINKLNEDLKVIQQLLHNKYEKEGKKFDPETITVSDDLIKLFENILFPSEEGKDKDFKTSDYDYHFSLGDKKTFLEGEKVTYFKKELNKLLLNKFL